MDYGAIYITPDYRKYSYQVVATSDSALLEIRGANNYQFNHIDDISLQPFAVPEPSTWALMIAGFGLAGSALRRRTRAIV